MIFLCILLRVGTFEIYSIHINFKFWKNSKTENIIVDPIMNTPWLQRIYKYYIIVGTYIGTTYDLYMGSLLLLLLLLVNVVGDRMSSSKTKTVRLMKNTKR